MHLYCWDIWNLTIAMIRRWGKKKTGEEDGRSRDGSYGPIYNFTEAGNKDNLEDSPLHSRFIFFLSAKYALLVQPDFLARGSEQRLRTVSSGCTLQFLPEVTKCRSHLMRSHRYHRSSSSAKCRRTTSRWHFHPSEEGVGVGRGISSRGVCKQIPSGYIYISEPLQVLNKKKKILARFS